MNKSKIFTIIILLLILGSFVQNQIQSYNQNRVVEFQDKHFKKYLLELNKNNDLVRSYRSGGYFPSMVNTNDYINLEEESIQQGYLNGFVALALDLEEVILNISFKGDLTSVIKELNQISSLEDVVKFRNLVNLKINNITVADLSPVSKLSTLSDLTIKKTNIMDLSPLKDNKKMKNLYLRETKINDIEPINSIKSLVFLQLYENQDIKDIELVNMMNLQGLRIDNMASRVQANLTLENLPALVGFTYQGANAGKVKLSKLPSLKRLEMSGTNININEEVLNELEAENIETISFTGGTNIKNIEFIKNFPKLQLLRLRYDHKIEELIINNQIITDKEFFIDMSNNRISHVKGLEHLSNLKGLILNDNEIKDISFLFDQEGDLIMKELAVLELQNNKIPQEQIEKYEPILQEHFGEAFKIGEQK